MPACGCKPPKDVTADSKADDAEPRYSPDGKTLAFVQQRIKFFYADRARLMLLDLATLAALLAAFWTAMQKAGI